MTHGKISRSQRSDKKPHYQELSQIISAFLFRHKFAGDATTKHSTTSAKRNGHAIRSDFPLRNRCRSFLAFLLSISSGQDILPKSAKRSCKPAQGAIKSRLVQWFNGQAFVKAYLTGDILRMRTKRFLFEVNELIARY